jgi:hypothetical protein
VPEEPPPVIPARRRRRQHANADAVEAAAQEAASRSEELDVDDALALLERELYGGRPSGSFFREQLQDYASGRSRRA